MPIELLSHLTYAERNAYLDSMRKILVCPHHECHEQRPWKDAASATVAGWSFEDRVVDGKTTRFWFCPAHRPADPLPALQPIDIPRYIFKPDRTKLEPKPDERFHGHQLVLLRYGAGKATQLAVVLKSYSGLVQIDAAAWRASSGEWTKKKLVWTGDVVGLPDPKDRRIAQAAKAWPPHWMKVRKK